MPGADEVRDALAGTVLAGRPVLELDGDVLAVEIDGGEVWPAWQAARSVVDATGRFPLCVTSWSDEPLAERWIDAGELAAAAEEARTLDPWTQFFANWHDLPADDGWLDLFERDRGITRAEIVAALGPSPTNTQIDRLLLDRAVAAGTVGEIDAWGTGLDQWFEPTGQPTAVLLTPTDLPWVAAGYNSYNGSLSSSAPVMAAARVWHEQWGAEIVASWDTMLQFVAATLPSTVDEAWQLAGEQLDMAGSLEMDQSALALALMRDGHWFLHDRP